MAPNVARGGGAGEAAGAVNTSEASQHRQQKQSERHAQTMSLTAIRTEQVADIPLR
jgi:hypothetical protein